MRNLILLAMLAPTLAVAPPVPGKKCATGPELAKREPARPLAARPLGDEPAAAQLLAVYRRVDGCAQPVVLRKGIGGNDDRPPAIKAEPRIRPLR